MFLVHKNCKNNCHYEERSYVVISYKQIHKLPSEITTARFRLTRFVMTFCMVVFSLNAKALEIVYDAEIDAYFKQISKPLIKKSGLKNVKLYLANKNEINAFATPQNEIVLYSGLINKMENQEQLKGVIAHEMGHLIARHYIKSRVKNSRSGVPVIAGTVLGIGAVIAGAPQAGYAAIIGGSAAGVSKQLAHSREHENEADSIALKLLKSTGNSPQGLAEFFRILQRQEQNFISAPPEFLSTHPSTQHRKSFIQNNLIIEEKIQPSLDFQIIKAKIFALSEKSKKVINKFSIEKDSVAKFLALAVATVNNGGFEQSFKHLDKAKELGLPKQWYYDMLGQGKYQQAKFAESIIDYKKSQQFGNLSWIMDFQIAESYFALKDKLALTYYFRALSKFKHFYYTYKRVGDYYAQDNQMAMAHYYLARYYKKTKNKVLMEKHLGLAEEFYKQEKLDNDFLKQQLAEMAEEDN